MRQGKIVLADKHPNVLGGIQRLLEDEVETVLMVADEISLRYLSKLQPRSGGGRSLAPRFKRG